jgi:gamma-glutamyltranspeptidase/glutathione hydrolase
MTTSASRRSPRALALFLALAAACRAPAPSTGAAPAAAAPATAPAVPARVAPVFPAGWSHPAGDKAVFAPHGMVASNSAIASSVGAGILRRGGNAVDAAVAVGFALAVAYPEAGNLGGGGFMVIRLANGRSAALDFREVAPRTATRDMYLDSTGKVDAMASLVGHRASGVPGSVAGLCEAQRTYGTLPLAAVMAPAIALADTGFIVDSTQERSIRAARRLIGRYAGAALFLPNGEPVAAGTRLVQRDLAGTLRAIAAGGPDAFYRGATAEAIAAEMRRGGGLITGADLAAYKPVWRTPIRSTYRGYGLLSMPPSSSGGVTVAEALNILETYDTLPRFGSAAGAHLLASALQRAFIDRNATLGDADFVTVPLERLTSKDYARRLRASIDAARATPTGAAAARMREGSETTHYSVVDGAGNAVATTTTLNNLYGSGVWVPGAGFFLNDEMDDFTVQPGVPNMFGLVQGEANTIQPGKRMLSAMAPTIVLDPAGNVLLVVGGRGGPRIISAVTEVIVNVIDHRMSLADAMNAPRLHHQALPDTIRYEAGGFTSAVLDSLRAMGYGLGAGAQSGNPTEALARIAAVMRVPGGWVGKMDSRSTGGAEGY